MSHNLQHGLKRLIKENMFQIIIWDNGKNVGHVSFYRNYTEIVRIDPRNLLSDLNISMMMRDNLTDEYLLSQMLTQEP